MGRKGLTRISQRQYANYLGISNEAVSKAVKEGRIKKGWDRQAEMIIVEHADREFGLLHKKTNVAPLLNNPGEDEENAKPGTLQLSGNSSYGEAKRVKEILHAQLVALDLKERKGELVNKDEVHKQLYAFGQQLRIALLAIPDRIIDNVLASKSRAEAHGLFASALHECLESMTRYNLNFQQQN